MPLSSRHCWNPPWTRFQKPALMIAVPMLAVCLVLHLSGPVTPALATDLLAFGLAAVADRWLVVSGIGVAILMVVTVLLPPAWPTLAEYASLIPLASALLQNRSRIAFSLGAGYLAINSWPIKSGAELMRALTLWFVAYAVLWATVDLLNRTREAREQATVAQLRKQRHAIARDLHDTVAHELSLMSMQVQRVSIRGSVEPRDLDQILESCDAAITQLRGMLTLIRLDNPDGPLQSTARRGLDEECRAAVTRLAQHGFTAEYTFEGSADLLPQTAEWALTGLCYEAISNIIRHGDPAGPVTLRVDADPESSAAQIAVSNQILSGSRGPRQAPLGLIGIRERVEAVGGRLYAGATGDQWLILASVPTPRRTPANPKEKV